MTDSILSQYSRARGEAGAPSGPQPEGDAADDLGAFGFLRGARERATMLELRKADGSIRAISYGWLERAEFDPSEGISLRANGQTVRLRGRNLNLECRPEVRLFSAICRHKVAWIQEAGRSDDLMSEAKETVVEAIEW